MIITLLLSFAYSVASGFQYLLGGSANLDGSLSGALTFAVNSVNGVSYLVNVPALFWSLTLVVGFEFVFWTFKGGVWIYRHIPFIGH